MIQTSSRYREATTLDSALDGLANVIVEGCVSDGNLSDLARALALNCIVLSSCERGVRFEPESMCIEAFESSAMLRCMFTSTMIAVGYTPEIWSPMVLSTMYR